MFSSFKCICLSFSLALTAIGTSRCDADESSPSIDDYEVSIVVHGDATSVHVCDVIQISGYLSGDGLDLASETWHASTPEAVQFIDGGYGGVRVQFLQPGPISIWCVANEVESNVLEFDVEAEPDGWPVPSLDGTWRSIKTDEIDVELTLRFLEDGFVTNPSARWRIADATHVNAAIGLTVPEEWQGDHIWAEGLSGHLDREGMFHMTGTIPSVNMPGVIGAQDVPAQTHLFGMLKDGRLYVSIITWADTLTGERPVPGWEGFLVFERVEAE